MGGFEAFLLAAVEKAPFLIGDAGATSSAAKAPVPMKQEKEEDNVRLQQLLVDGPLQPLGAEHIVYHTLLPAFRATMKSAEGVWRARQALAAAAEARAGDTEVKDGAHNGTSTTLGPTSTIAQCESCTDEHPSAEALQHALCAAQVDLSKRKKCLDSTYAKTRALVEAIVRHSEATRQRNCVGE